MITQVNVFTPIDNMNGNKDLTRGYSVSSQNASQIYFFDDYYPMFNPSDSIWQKILADIIETHKDAWDKLAEM